MKNECQYFKSTNFSNNNIKGKFKTINIIKSFINTWQIVGSIYGHPCTYSQG